MYNKLTMDITGWRLVVGSAASEQEMRSGRYLDTPLQLMSDAFHSMAAGVISRRRNRSNAGLARVFVSASARCSVVEM